MLKLHRAGEQRANAWAYSTSYFEEGALVIQSAKCRSNASQKIRYVFLQIHVYLHVDVCVSLNIWIKFIEAPCMQFSTYTQVVMDVRDLPCLEQAK